MLEAEKNTPRGDSSNAKFNQVDIYKSAFELFRDGLKLQFALLRLFFYINAILIAAWGLANQSEEYLWVGIVIAGVGIIVASLCTRVPRVYTLYLKNTLEVAAKLDKELSGPAHVTLTQWKDREVRWPNAQSLPRAFAVLVTIMWLALIAYSILTTLS
jgi:hypothetical protein